MIAGKAGDALRAFDDSEMMQTIRGLVQSFRRDGFDSVAIAWERLGNSLEAIFIITLLREDGYTVETNRFGIEVKGEVKPEWNTTTN